ncbi:MAG: hypothetical protein MUC92_13510 [Fimbriimonadaceae bacterium]|jgi:exopolyphosphatase/guanosine-5'-triphosphate,3'-diphosphate pyrophosphatase|nr:hypothetical protein [Fimbriimonadaceae bacterium]
MPRLFAAADIGSNTVHLLVAEPTPTGLRRVVNESVWLNLGEVVGREGHVPKKLADELVSTLSRFKAITNEHKVAEFYVFATEAMRRATNHDELLDRISREANVRVEIISPRREADLSVNGLQLDCSLAGPCLMVEAGGGSVQVALLYDGKLEAEKSLPLGTGALIAKSGLQQPASETQVLKTIEIIDQALDEVRDLAHADRVIACGGVARGIVRALHPDGDPTLAIQDLEYLAWDAQRLTSEQITRRYGVKHRRAMTLLPGCLVYHALLASFAIPSMTVSNYGVREGAVREMAQGVRPWR